MTSYQRLKEKNRVLKADVDQMRRIIARGTFQERADLMTKCCFVHDMADQVWFGGKEES